MSQLLGQTDVITVATVRQTNSTISVTISSVPVEAMLDSGSTISLLREDMLASVAANTQSLPHPQHKLVTASGQPLTIVNCVKLTVCLNCLGVSHKFVVVQDLITPGILGIDFLQQHNLILNFFTSPVTVSLPQPHLSPPIEIFTSPPEMQHIVQAEQQRRAKVCSVMTVADPALEIVKDAVIPLFGEPVTFEYPGNIPSVFLPVVNEYTHLFRNSPGFTTIAYHHIPIQGSPVRVPPRRIPAHYRETVEKQIHQMLEQGVIEESCSPWMAPAVYVPKKSGEIRLCIDYRELNKHTVKDAYPLPLVDEVQDRLSGCSVFSTLDLQCGYWQLPVNPADVQKTAFCPGPGMGLYQFKRMPFGLTGALGSFQRLMDKIMCGLPFVTTYIDDVLVHSKTAEEHKNHLQIVFQRLSDAGLTLRGHKCTQAMSQVTYLGHKFTQSGLTPDRSKIQAVQDWPTPANVSSLRQFLGLASYYQRYISKFSTIAAPLTQLTHKRVVFSWSAECESSFQSLKSALTQAPILAYPDLNQNSSPFVLQTDASTFGLVAVLEQDGRVIAYASRTLTKCGQNYSVIQKEYLAIVYTLKQFRHYLLGRKFLLLTDHAPLQWLGSQKMEGMLCRWALSIQEFNFDITYRKGSLNTNADALSRRDQPHSSEVTALTVSVESPKQLAQCQQGDEVTKKLYDALLSSSSIPSGKLWRHCPFHRYKQIWSQLKFVDEVLCRCYSPGPTSNTVTVPILPKGLQVAALHRCHDNPSGGHLGYKKTLHKLQQEAYWVYMS